MSKGFAVVDLETTGLFPTKHDRIVEVGIVLMSPGGEIESRHETLVNPMRDMGPQHIHGITAAAAARAPIFERIAPRIAELLDDRVPVAHNASFDSRFLGYQMAEAGLSVAEPDRWFCTMRMSEHWSGYRRLAECCLAAGVELLDAHSAGGDAYATAELLHAYMRAVSDRQYWAAWLASTSPHGPYSVDASVPWVPRSNTFEPEPSFVSQLVGSLTTSSIGSHLNVDYLALLDRVMLDRVVSISEGSALLDLAATLGLTPDDVRLAHRAYFDGLVTAAWADHIVTADEAIDIREVGEILGIDTDSVAGAISRAPATDALVLSSGFHLSPGDIVVLTGEMSKPRDAWAQVLTGMGLVVKDNVVKKTKLLVAADPDSMSGKAKQARDYGVTIVNETGLEKLIHG
ncbi:DNA polymerase III subunit epsilon [Diaminobutyricibacter tongyongensis]|uniref:DNA polymerase III subunit epsilon n=1 Tax=Leifsonia tongyongensis TaxID=1268043 RepID=A0A6L9XTM0_9MICO|nr:exonuclease domain-containing protein [Diaminobutyricibacter tongyongensis]NEN04656.1 DNA polymerase III subunit epsilon [Diaminobutyricibacter tongyongensis]